MKTRFAQLTLLIASLSLLQACGGITPYKAPMMQGVVITESMLEDLQVGLHQSQVRQLLGPDYGANPFKPNHWEYIYTSSNTTLHSEAIRHLIIKFDDNGYLTDWQRIK
ncbi:outer membrane protein assembly factor BamE [Thiomicrospira sp. R3]|uniref:outer membrane protein assembly factor BamE n=1 Tax=Thiomicrospira sp. R3 TaxID=3035472 RepID=UPI00259BD7A7|nr:outer membrane protein assembly factor BamE [Thiomicrospira sp. R3]WFE68122.1 outer membrane protein assembly factor BamE [Thiomicrospira sp. R3]